MMMVNRLSAARQRTEANSITLAAFIMLMAFAVGAPSVAFAQAPTDEEVEEFAPPPAPQKDTGAGSVKEDLELYWGGNRKEDVIIGHLFAKGGRFELGLFGGVIPNDAFLTYVPLGGRAAYFFTHQLSLELAGSWDGVQLESDLLAFLKAEGKLTSDAEIVDKQHWRANAVVMWSPFYGKLALLQRKLSHFDLNVAAGLGAVQLSSPKADEIEPTEETSIQPEVVLGAGMRFFVNDYLSLRFDYRQGIVPFAEDAPLAPVEFTFGLSFLTGGE